MRASEREAEREDYRFGVLASLMHKRRRGQRARTPADFFPSLRPKPSKARMSADEVRDALLATFGGKPTKGGAA